MLVSQHALVRGLGRASPRAAMNDITQVTTNTRQTTAISSTNRGAR